MKRSAEVPRADSPGVIEAGAVYTLDEFQRRLRLGQHAMREARRAGLRVRRIGRRAYVMGQGRARLSRVSHEMRTRRWIANSATWSGQRISKCPRASAR